MKFRPPAGARPTLAIAAFTVAAIAACKSQRFADSSLATASVGAAAQQWRNAMASLDPGAATARGDHRFDHDLSPPTKDRVSLALELLREAKKSLDSYYDDNLYGDAKADRKLVLYRIEADTITFDRLRTAERDLAWSAGVAFRAYVTLEESPDLPKEDRASAFVSRLAALPNYFQGVRDGSRMPWQAQAEIAVSITEGLVEYLEGNVLERVGDTRPAAAEALKAAQDAAHAHLDWLQQRVTLGPQGHHRLQKDVFEAILRAESGLEIDANAVVSLAQGELEGARKRFEAAAKRAMPQKEDMDSAMAATLQALATGRPLDAATLRTLAEEASNETWEFSKGAGIVSIPPVLRLRAAAAPGASAGGAITRSDAVFNARTKAIEGIFRITTPNSALPAGAQEEWLSAFSPARLRMLALTEGVPGIALARAARVEAASATRRDIVLEGFDRGWGEYARRTSIDAGFRQTDPLTPAAAAAADMVVAARALCAARIHAGSMTLTEAREVFRRDALLPGEMAMIEARHCGVDPCVALELIGRIEMEKLMRDLQGKRGLSAIAARDRCVRSGALPFDALRDLLLQGTATN